MGIKTIHAGHGGRNNFDPGAVGNGYQESQVARQITQKMLAKTGAIDTTDNAGTSVNENLANISAKTNAVANDNDWNISNHLNSASPQATGVEVFYFGSDREGQQKAAAISAAIANALGIPNRGAKDGSGLYVIRNTKGHSLLIEWAFISNAGDMQKLMSNMDAAVDAVIKCFGYAGGSTNKPTTPPKQPSQPSKPAAKGWIAESGIFTLKTAIKLRTGDSTSASVIAILKAGNEVRYDAFRIDQNGYLWIRQPRSNGYGYLATGETRNGKRSGEKWGNFR